MRFGNHADDLRQESLRADTLRQHHQRSRTVDGGPHHTFAGHLFYGNRLARYHRLIHRAVPLDHYSVNRDFFSGTYPEPVSGLYLIQGNVFLSAVVSQEPRRLRRQAQECPDCRAGLAARPQLQYLAQQHESDNDRCRLEVHADLAQFIPERRGEDAGKQRAYETVHVRHSYSEGDQREHVEIPGHHRLPPADKERPPAPQDDGSRQGQLHP